jgi:hypothetical protein
MIDFRNSQQKRKPILVAFVANGRLVSNLLTGKNNEAMNCKVCSTNAQIVTTWNRSKSKQEKPNIFSVWRCENGHQFYTLSKREGVPSVRVIVIKSSSNSKPNPERMLKLLHIIDELITEINQVRKTSARRFNRPPKKARK